MYLKDVLQNIVNFPQIWGIIFMHGSHQFCPEIIFQEAMNN